MKQFDVKQERTLNGNKFFVRPFGAFKAANMSGEIVALVAPILTGLAPVLLDGEDSILDTDATVMATQLSNSMQGLSGDKIEEMLKKLLVKYGNVSVLLEGERDAQLLTEDLASDLFVGETQDMFILAWDVIKANFSGFFKNLGDQFGGLLSSLKEKGSPSSTSTEN